MAIFKKDVHSWFSLGLALLILVTLCHFLIALTERAEAPLKPDHRYAEILGQIHTENLDPERVRVELAAEKSPVERFEEQAIGIVIIFVLYDIIFRCVARLLFGSWRGPWLA